MIDVDVVRTAARLPTPGAAARARRPSIDAWVRRYHPDAVAIERVFADVNVASVMGTAQASAVADARRRVARHTGAPAHPHRGQGRRDRQRPGRQGAGHRDGHPPAAARPSAPKPADAADALALAICHVWRGGAAGPARRRAVAAQTGSPGDRVRPRAPCCAAGLDSVVVEVGGVGMLVHTTPAHGRRSARPARPAALATALVVREDSLTLYGFADEDERQVFETVQTVSGCRAATGPGDARGAQPRRACARAIAADDLVALTRCPASAARAPSGSCSSCATRSACRPASGVASAPPGIGRPWQRAGARGPGRARLDRHDRPTTPCEAVAPQAADGATVSALLKAALQELGR